MTKKRTEAEQRHYDFRARPYMPRTDAMADQMIVEWLVARLGKERAIEMIKAAPDHKDDPAGLYHKFGSVSPQHIKGKWC